MRSELLGHVIQGPYSARLSPGVAQTCKGTKELVRAGTGARPALPPRRNIHFSHYARSPRFCRWKRTRSWLGGSGIGKDWVPSTDTRGDGIALFLDVSARILPPWTSFLPPRGAARPPAHPQGGRPNSFPSPAMPVSFCQQHRVRPYFLRGGGKAGHTEDPRDVSLWRQVRSTWPAHSLARHSPGHLDPSRVLPHWRHKERRDTRLSSITALAPRGRYGSTTPDTRYPACPARPARPAALRTCRRPAGGK